MRRFNPEDLITVDRGAGKAFLKQTVYEYGDKFELRVMTTDDIEYGYCICFYGYEDDLAKWPKTGLSTDDVNDLMIFLVELTGHKPKQR